MHTDRACSEVGNGFEITASRDAKACVLLRVVSQGLDPTFTVPCKCRQPREGVESLSKVRDRAGVATAASSASRWTAWELQRGGCIRVWSYKLAHISGGE